MIAAAIIPESVTRILAIVLIFGLMIVVHELGHLVFARMARMRVHEFSVGFGPALLALRKAAGRWRLTLFPRRAAPTRTPIESSPEYRATVERLRGQGLEPSQAAAEATRLVEAEQEAAQVGEERAESTTWSLRPFIPIGGYVNIAGIDPDEDVPDGFDKKPVLWRIAVITAGPAMNVVLAIIIYILIGSVFGIPGLPEPVVGKVLSGRPAAKAGLQAGDTFLRVGDVVITRERAGASSVKQVRRIKEEIEGRPREKVPVVVERDGRRLSLTVVPKPITDETPLLTIRGMQFGGLPRHPPYISRIESHAPAATLDIERGDLVVNVGGTPVKTIGETHKALVAMASQPTPVVLERGGVMRIVALPLSPPAERQRERELKYRPVNVVIGRMGVLFHAPAERLGLGAAITSGFGTFYAQLRDTTGVLALVVTRRAPAKVAGPVGISRMLYQSAEVGWRGFLGLAAVLCLWIAVLNLIPLPALDGSRIAFLVGEAVRGRPLIAPAREAVVHIVGMMLLLTVIVLITYKDIVDWVYSR